ncbi:MAG: hypothetical protein HQM15_01705 [Deltaproteobacteria bacterium]|nr:hypothetical protein [Deltaproteobacteria bacterium]
MKNPFLLFLFWLFLFFAEQQSTARLLFFPGVSFVVFTYALLNLEREKILGLAIFIFFIRAVFCSSNFLVFIEFFTLVVLRLFLSFSQGGKIFMEAVFSSLAVFLSKLLFLFLSPEYQITVEQFRLGAYLNLFFSSLLFLWIIHEPAALFEERYFSLGSRKGQLYLLKARKLRKHRLRRRFGLKNDW